MANSVDLLGLDQFGTNPGLNPIYGTLIGGGVAGVTSIALRHATSGTPQKYADLFGFGVGLAAAGALYSMPSTRHAAFGALAGAFFASLFGFLEKQLMGAEAVAAATAPAAAAGVGYPMIQSLGIPQITALNGAPQAQLMGHQISEISRSYGTIPGVAGAQLSGNGGPPISLMGEQSQQQQQAQLMGGPPTSAIANAYGANLFGGRS